MSVSRRSLSYLSNTNIDKLADSWTSPIYAFFQPYPRHKQGELKGKLRTWHEFSCGAAHCTSKGRLGSKVRRYADTKDEKSTSNLRTHAEGCWGTQIVAAALKANLDIPSTRESLGKAQLRDGSLFASFKRRDGQMPVTFSARPHTYKETR